MGSLNTSDVEGYYGSFFGTMDGRAFVVNKVLFSSGVDEKNTQGHLPLPAIFGLHDWEVSEFHTDSKRTRTFTRSSISCAKRYLKIYYDSKYTASILQLCSRVWVAKWNECSQILPTKAEKTNPLDSLYTYIILDPTTYCNVRKK